MNTLYIECNMGAAGDMIFASLLELIDNPAEFIEFINNIGLESVKIDASDAVKCGIKGTSVSVLVHGHEEDDHHHHHHHSSISDVNEVIKGLDVSQSVKSNAKAVYNLLAEAEANAHGVDVALVHFHEVGALDAIADIVGVCALIERLSPERIVVSPINTGTGQVRTSHGILPVPAPATAFLLKDVPIYSNDISGELCTPTGAALLKHFADEFAYMPPGRISKTGYGMGKKDFKAANCVRVFSIKENDSGTNRQIDELSCNLDDMTPEAIGFAAEVLFENGALDVFAASIYMKKNRPAVMLTCLCKPCDSDKLAALMLKYTTTIGVRKKACQRYILDTGFETAETKYGTVRIKTSQGYGVKKSKPEYDDIAAIAKKHGVTFDEIYKCNLT